MNLTKAITDFQKKRMYHSAQNLYLKNLNYLNKLLLKQEISLTEYRIELTYLNHQLRTVDDTLKGV